MGIYEELWQGENLYQISPLTSTGILVALRFVGGEDFHPLITWCPMLHLALLLLYTKLRKVQFGGAVCSSVQNMQ